MLLEVVGFWVILWYNNHRDVYIVNMVIRLGLVLYIVRVKGWLSLYLLMIMIPLVGRYMKILTGLIGRLFLNESLKKLLTLLVVMVLGGPVLEFGYIICFMIFTNGVLGAVLMGVYVFVLVGVRMWAVLMIYVWLGNYIIDSYKILGLGILPLIIFFVKVCGNYILIWMVIIYAMFNIL